MSRAASNSNTIFPPTPAPSTDLRPKVEESVLQSRSYDQNEGNAAFHLGPSAMGNSQSGSDRSSSSETAEQYQRNSKKGAINTNSSQNTKTLPTPSNSPQISKKRAAAADEDGPHQPANKKQLPPPPSRSRKIIQMKPKGSPSTFGAASGKSNPENTSAVSDLPVQTSPPTAAASKPSRTSTSNAQSNNGAGSGTAAVGGGRKKSNTGASDKNTAGAGAGAGAAGAANGKGTSRKVARKTAHSLIERRRRSKMNEEFGVLKDMIPACRGVEMHKLAILQASIDYLRYLEGCLEDMRGDNQDPENRRERSINSGASYEEAGSRGFSPRERDIDEDDEEEEEEVAANDEDDEEDEYEDRSNEISRYSSRNQGQSVSRSAYDSPATTAPSPAFSARSSSQHHGTASQHLSTQNNPHYSPHNTLPAIKSPHQVASNAYPSTTSSAYAPHRGSTSWHPSPYLPPTFSQNYVPNAQSHSRTHSAHPSPRHPAPINTTIPTTSGTPSHAFSPYSTGARYTPTWPPTLQAPGSTQTSPLILPQSSHSAGGMSVGSEEDAEACQGLLLLKGRDRRGTLESTIGESVGVKDGDVHKHESGSREGVSRESSEGRVRGISVRDLLRH